jgi:hypothetical protein
MVPFVAGKEVAVVVVVVVEALFIYTSGQEMTEMLSALENTQIFIGMQTYVQKIYVR